MHSFKNHNSIDSAIQSIETIVLKNRCSLSNEDLILLQQCKEKLLEVKEIKISKETKMRTIFQVVELLTRFFIAFNNFPDVF